MTTTRRRSVKCCVECSVFFELVPVSLASGEGTPAVHLSRERVLWWCSEKCFAETVERSELHARSRASSSGAQLEEPGCTGAARAPGAEGAVLPAPLGRSPKARQGFIQILGGAEHDQGQGGS